MTSDSVAGSRRFSATRNGRPSTPEKSSSEIKQLKLFLPSTTFSTVPRTQTENPVLNPTNTSHHDVAQSTANALCALANNRCGVRANDPDSNVLTFVQVC